MIQTPEFRNPMSEEQMKYDFARHRLNRIVEKEKKGRDRRWKGDGEEEVETGSPPATTRRSREESK
jgi:hypothetical protein